MQSLSSPQKLKWHTKAFGKIFSSTKLHILFYWKKNKTALWPTENPSFWICMLNAKKSSYLLKENFGCSLPRLEPLSTKNISLGLTYFDRLLHWKLQENRIVSWSLESYFEKETALCMCSEKKWHDGQVSQRDHANTLNTKDWNYYAVFYKLKKQGEQILKKNPRYSSLKVDRFLVILLSWLELWGGSILPAAKLIHQKAV